MCSSLRDCFYALGMTFEVNRFLVNIFSFSSAGKSCKYRGWNSRPLGSEIVTRNRRKSLRVSEVADNISAPFMQKFLLIQAVEVGREICREAIWDGPKHCRWSGAKLVRYDRQDTWREQLESREYEMATLGPDLYGGTAGIGLFLSELFSKSGVEEFRKTALGALNAATFKAKETSSPNDMGLLSGYAGMLWALNRAARCLDEPSLRRETSDLWECILSGTTHTASLSDDWVSGSAGVLACLISLYRTSGASEYLELALTLGRKLCGHAEWHEDYCYWVEAREPNADERQPMCGFAHGVSGIAVPLLQLYAITRDREFLLTARGAFAYEDTLFLPEYRNWADTRIPFEPGKPVPHMTAWCHGAPGIALGHLVGLEKDIEQADDHREKLTLALETTLGDLERTPLDRDSTICHGTFGLIEIANICDAHAPKLDAKRRASAVAQKLIAWHAENGRWPHGAQGRSACLFTGESGIGHTMLRVAFGDDVAPILLI